LPVLRLIKMNLCAGRTVDSFVTVLWHFIAIIQPVLNQRLGRGAGEKQWAAHPAIVAPSENLTLRYLNWGSCRAYSILKLAGTRTPRFDRLGGPWRDT
jgi:hypothetical protein